jgi:hypothetical protein
VVEQTKPFRVPRRRNGFYRGPQGRLGVRPYRIPIESGAWLCWQRQLVTTEFDFIELCSIHGKIYQHPSQRYVGYLHWYTFHANPFEEVFAEEFFELCDSESQQLCDFASDILYKGKVNIGELLAQGPIAFYHLLEVREAFAHQGLGIRAFRALGQVLRVETALHYGFLEPVPLQFASPFLMTGISRRDLAEYKDARHRLAEYYE